MEDIIHTILPVFAVIALGHVLGRREFVPHLFFKAADSMVYYVFFPVMLFWKIGGAGDVPLSLNLIGATVGAVLIGLIAGLVYIRVSGLDAYRCGSFAQLSIRFNSYIGLAVVLGALGEKGVVDFGIIMSVNIPLINVLVVTALIWFSKGEYAPADKARLVLKAMLVNPLIVACLAGLLYRAFHVPFPRFFANTFSLLSAAALPLALLSIGHSLTFAAFKGYFSASLASSVIKLLVMPAAGYFLLKLFGVEGTAFQTAMIYLALPTATSAYILSSQMGSDPELASAGIVLSTFLSFVSLSAVILLWGA